MKGFLRLQLLAGLALVTLAPWRAALGQLSHSVTVSATEVLVNQPVTYTVGVTNLLAFPVQLIVTNEFLSPIQIVSVTNTPFGFVTNTGAGATFYIPSFSIFPPAVLTVTMRPTVAGLLTNRISIHSPDYPYFTNFDAVITVTNATPPTNDLAVAVSGPRLGTLVNDLVPYSIRVSNLSSVTATNVALTNQIPASVQIVSGPTNRVLTLSRVPGGSSTNLQFTLRPTTNGVLTLTASAGAPGFSDSNSANNTATTNIVVQAFVAGQLVATNLGPMTFNPQHSLMDQPVRLVNVSTSMVDSARVIVRGLTTNWLYNAVGTNVSTGGARDPFVVHASPLAPGESVDLLLEFVVTNRLPVVIPDSDYLAVPMPALSLAATTNATFQIDSQKQLADGAFLIEFRATPGRTYTIVYGTSLTNTMVAQPPIVAQADRVQWIDDGPPKTISHPTNSPLRFYRAMLNP